ncbi:ligninase LG6 precursor [Paraphoma chrysanthemicola]|uniref:Peroxidase n=1 Tax=Paraphoma chrysanthemicola TaxID=798071 RepID=A0A8K0R3B8_9PLEO|nr:ligninase LG6 precursor [Paraphoma chrysanthemicola]
MPSYTFTLLALIASTSAFNLWPRQSGSCPSVWTDVAKELQTTFSGCGRDAHGAIRAPFHDCINNACDGSLILADECGRAENAGLSDICGKLQGWSTKYSVGAADIIQFAAAVAIAECPLGPKVKALVGRKDSSTAAALNSMPSSKDSVDKILAAFSAKGFSSDDVVALMGTHSVAVQVNDDPSQAGKSLDSTPSVYDTKFYTETKDGTAPYSLQSDKLLSNDTKTEQTWSNFGNSQDAWSAKFVDAWNRFAVIGNDVGSLQDCSSLMPSSSSKRRRAMSMPMGARAYAQYHP